MVSSRFFFGYLKGGDESMTRDTGMVLQWIGGRKRLLDLIAAKIGDDREMDLVVSQCRNWDRRLLKAVLAERGRIKADAEEPAG